MAAEILRVQYAGQIPFEFQGKTYILELYRDAQNPSTHSFFPAGERSRVDDGRIHLPRVHNGGFTEYWPDVYCFAVRGGHSRPGNF